MALVAAMGAAPLGPFTKVMAPKKVTITPVDNKMEYTKPEVTVEPGQEIRLVFKNTATSAAMQHNVVVLNTPEKSVMKAVAQAGLNAGPANNYVPDHDAILTHTPLSKPGETVEVTFTAPEAPGEYGYLCTFPGHWSTMQGTMYVEE
jgi:azurin